MKKIAVVGVGYVGLSLAMLLSKKNNVVAFDISKEKILKLQQKKAPIKDTMIQEYLTNEKLNFTATTEMFEAYKNADFVIIATPTNYAEELGLKKQF